MVIFKFYIWVFCFLICEDEEEAGLLELLKSQICDNAALYAQKYDEEFQRYLPRFVTAIWNLLVTTGQEVKYDLVRWRWRRIIKTFSSYLPQEINDSILLLKICLLKKKMPIFVFHSSW